jgi:hypothetical protein
VRKHASVQITAYERHAAGVVVPFVVVRYGGTATDFEVRDLRTIIVVIIIIRE